MKRRQKLKRANRGAGKVPPAVSFQGLEGMMGTLSSLLQGTPPVSSRSDDFIDGRVSAFKQMSLQVPIAILAKLRADISSGDLAATTMRLRSEAVASGVGDDDLESAVLVGYLVELATSIKDTISQRAEKEQDRT